VSFRTLSTHCCPHKAERAAYPREPWTATNRPPALEVPLRPRIAPPPPRLKRWWPLAPPRRAARTAPFPHLTPTPFHAQVHVWVKMLARRKRKGRYHYTLLWADGSTSSLPSGNIPNAAAWWQQRNNFVEDVVKVRVNATGVEGEDGEGAWHRIVDEPDSVPLQLAIKWASAHGTAVVPGIDRVRATRGVWEAQYEGDPTGDYHEFEPPQRTAESEAMWLALDKAKGNGGTGVRIPGGDWGGGVTGLPAGSPFGGSGGRLVTPLVPSQFLVDGCVKGAVLNASLLTDLERSVVQSMPLRFNLKEIAPFFRDHKLPLEVQTLKRWYPGYSSDPERTQLLGYLLSIHSRGHVVVNVEQTDGGKQHHLLFDCDERWVYDASPRFGDRAHPLTEATMEVMGIKRIVFAGKLVRTEVARKRNASTSVDRNYGKKSRA